MIKIQILSANIDERGGTIQRGERKGETYHIRNQEGYVHNGHAFPERFKISLGDAPAYAPQMFYLDPGCIEIGEYGNLQVSRSLKLLNEEQAAQYLREQLPPSLLARLVELATPAKPKAA